MTKLQRHIFDAIELLSPKAQERLARLVMVEMEKAEEPAPAPAPEYSVSLSSCGSNKIAVIKTIREFTGMMLKEAKDASEVASGAEIYRTRDAEYARRFMVALSAAGALTSFEEIAP